MSGLAPTAWSQATSSSPGCADVATELHTAQGMDLSAVPRMSADDVVTAALRGLELGEVGCAPGVEDAGPLDAAVTADLAAFGAQSPQLARRCRVGAADGS